MKVFYDGFIFTLQSTGGINRYFSKIIDHLPSDIDPTLITCLKRELTFPVNPNLKIKIHKRFAFRPGRLAFLLEKYLFNLEYRRVKPDIYHPSYYFTLLRKPFSKFSIPTVATVYDCIYERFGDEFDPKGAEREAKRKMIENADVILTISNSTKEDIMYFYNIPEERIIVHYLASEIDPPSKDLKAKGDEYFLFVGNRWSYKNFDLLYQVMKKINSGDKLINLKVVGPPFNDNEKALYNDKYLDHCGPVNDAELAKLYAGSLALVYPSSYEGFGLPPLEAMRCHTPVICFNTSSLPEVVGNAGILVEPSSQNDLADAMLALSTDPELRKKHINLGIEQAKQFSWKETTKILVDTYRSLI